MLEIDRRQRCKDIEQTVERQRRDYSLWFAIVVVGGEKEVQFADGNSGTHTSDYVTFSGLRT